jgi:tetratricopeptide (TPR) repeat protein
MVFGLFKKKEGSPFDVDYMGKAEEFEAKGDYSSAIEEYQKIINIIYRDKPVKAYLHISKKILKCYMNMGDYDKVFELWPLQYNPVDYDASKKYELIKLLEQANRQDLVMRVYDQAGKSLARNKIEFLIKQKKVPEADALMKDLLATLDEYTPGIVDLWLTKSKLSLSLRKWEEANRYLSKIIEKSPKHDEARKLKEFCLKQLRM